MTLRGGYGTKTKFYGVIREDSYPIYQCIHDHASSSSATVCGRRAVRYIKANPEAPLPTGWINYRPEIK